MNIRDLNSSVVPAEYAKAGVVACVDGAEAVGISQQVVEQHQVPEAEDRLELPDVARAAHSQQQGNGLAQAREALDELSGLSEERAAEIRTRLQEGYYTRPEVVSQIAERLAEAIVTTP